MLSPTQEEDLYRLVGMRIQTLRRDHLTQEELADLVGLSRASIANLEAGRQRVPLHHLFGIAEALGTSVADLLPDRQDLGLDLADSAVTNAIAIVSDDGKLSPAAREFVARVLQGQKAPK